MIRKYSAVLAMALVAGTLAFLGCKDGNLFGGFHKKGTGDPASLLSDAKAALSRREFSNAKAYYENIIASQPGNSEALYGAATASMGTAGLDTATLLSNVINAKSAAGAGVLQQSLQLASFGAPSVIDQADINNNSILKGLDLGNLSGGIDQIVCFLLKIRSGNADGVISPEDISLLLSVGITCIIRGILRPLEVNVIDLRQTADGTDFDVEIISPTLLAQYCKDNTIRNSISDLAGGVQAIQTAVNKLGSTSGSSLGGLKLDLENAFNQFKTKFALKANEQIAATSSQADKDALRSCIDFVNSFDVTALQPPTQDPGDCLNKSNTPLH